MFEQKTIENTVIENEVIEGLSLENKVFERVTFRSTVFRNVKIHNTRFVRCNFINVQFLTVEGTYMDMANSSFQSSSVENSTFKNFRATGLHVENFTIKESTFYHFSVSGSFVRLKLTKSHAESIQIEPLKISGADVLSCSIVGAFIRDIEMQNFSMQDTDLSDIDFANVKIESSGFKNVRFSGISVEKAILNEINLSESSLSGISIYDFVMAAALIKNTTVKECEGTRWSINNSNMTGLSVFNSSISLLSLRKTTTSKCRMENLSFNSAQVENCIFRDCSLISVEWTYSHLKNTSFPGSVFERVNLSTSILENSDISKISSRESIFPPITSGQSQCPACGSSLNTETGTCEKCGKQWAQKKLRIYSGTASIFSFTLALLSGPFMFALAFVLKRAGMETIWPLLIMSSVPLTVLSLFG